MAASLASTIQGSARLVTDLVQIDMRRHQPELDNFKADRCKMNQRSIQAMCIQVTEIRSAELHNAAYLA